MKTLERYFKKAWSDPRRFPPNPSYYLLDAFSVFYSIIMEARNRFYDRKIFTVHRLPCPVISVGNITLGGTGKTPAVILIADILQKAGYRPAVLSRGYGGKGGGSLNVVSDGRNILAGPDAGGDEPVLIANSLRGIPVLTGPKRYQTGRYAVDRMGSNVLILDDGFQHRCLHRDLDIVLLHHKDPLGNGFVIPRGPLRESVSSLKRADLLILTGPEEETKVPVQPVLEKICPGVPILRAHHMPRELLRLNRLSTYSPEYLKGKKIFAFAGIARPESFQETLRSLDGNILYFLPYSDHHRYTEEDIKKIGAMAQKLRADLLLTTEKDGVKLARFAGLPENTLMLSIEMRINPPETEFAKLLLEKLKK